MVDAFKFWACLVIGFYLIRFLAFMSEPFIDLARSEFGLIAWACEKWHRTLCKWGQIFNPLPSLPNCSVDGWSPKENRDSESSEIESAEMIVVSSHICGACHRILSPIERSRFTV